MHAEMTHFLRNIDGYLSTEVVEMCWIEFLQRVALLCGVSAALPVGGQTVNKGEGLEIPKDFDDVSLVDRLIQAHEDYVESMLVSSVCVSNKSGELAVSIQYIQYSVP